MRGTDRGALPPLEEDFAVMCEAVRTAGAAVLDRYWDQTSAAWLKRDASPVSEADLEANEILRKHLMGPDRRDYGWLSEESPDDAYRLAAPRTWIVDPIDGTRAFLEQRPEFTVCVALVEDGQAHAAAVFNPVTGEFFDAVRDQGARLNGKLITTRGTTTLEGCRVLSAARLVHERHWPMPWPRIEFGYRNSTAYRMALVANGTYDAALALIRKPDWDVAPGALIVAEAGGRVSDHHGTPFIFNQKAPMQRALVCSAPGLHQPLLDRLAHLPADLRGQR